MIKEHPSPPIAPEPTKPALSGMFWRELGLPRQMAWLFLRSPFLLKAPKVTSKPIVILIPGWMAPEACMEPLRLYLQYLGHDARHWGFGVNLGDPESDRLRLAERVRKIAAEEGRPVSLVGWSLGGVIARETAREAPHCVSHVVTYGTPALGGPTHTLAADKWGEDECRRIHERTREADLHRPIQVPMTIIFSKWDFVVSWPACIDRHSPRATHFEVSASHVGMGVHPDVWSIVGERLPRGEAASSTVPGGLRT